MKKFHYLLICIILILTSCNKDDVFSSQDLTKGDLTTIRVGLDNGVQTRVAYGDPDLKTEPMDVTLFVIHVTGTDDTPAYILVDKVTKTQRDISKGITFDQRLVKDQKYKLFVWADFGKDYYTLPDLGATGSDIRVALASNDLGEKSSINYRDAYMELEDNVQAGDPVSMTLTRPFALIKISTKDHKENTVVKAGLLPTKYSVTYSGYTAINIVNKEAVDLGNKNITIENAATADAESSGELSFDYLFANETNTNLGFEMTYYNGSGKVGDFTFSNIEYKRNFRTNISGYLLTKRGDVAVEVDQDWDGNSEVFCDVNEIPADNNGFGPISQYILSAGEAAAAVGVKTTCDIYIPVALGPLAGADGPRPIIIPDIVSGGYLTGININLTQGITTPIVIKDESPDKPTDNYVGSITLILPTGTTVEAANAIEFNVPNAHVVIKGTDGTVIKEIKAATGDSTLEIEEGVEVTKLTVNKGSVINRGTITDIIVAVGEGNVTTIDNYGSITGTITIESGSYVLTETASTALELRAALVNPNVARVILTADVEWVSENPGSGAADNQDAFRIGLNDASDYYEERPMDGFVFDGGGYKISGVAYNNVLAVYAHGVTIKNLVIEQNETQKTTRSNGGLSIYRSTGVKIQNVTIRNTGKAGVIVNAATATATGLHTSGNAWGGVNVSKGGAPQGGNKPEFTFDATSTFGEAAQIYVSLDRTGDDYQVNAPGGWMSGLRYFDATNTVEYVYSSTPFTPVFLAPAKTVAVKADISTEAGKIVKVGDYIFITGTNVYTTIAGAMTNVEANGTVLLADGTYNENLEFPGKALSVIGESRAGAIINGRIYSALAGNIVMKSLTINAVSVNDGYATYFNACSFKFDNCNLDFTVAVNSTLKNVVVVKAASLEVTNCEITGKSYFKKGSSMDVMPMVYFSHAGAGEYAVKFTGNNIKFDCGATTAISSSNGNAFFLSGTRAGTNQLVVTGNNFTDSSAPNNANMPGIKRESGTNYVEGTTTVTHSNNTKDGGDYTLRVESKF